MADPVLRRWMIGRVFGRWPGEPSFSAHRPPYLFGMLPLAAEIPTTNFAEMADTLPSSPIELVLAGKKVTVHPGEEAALFERTFDDIEALLSLHRFSWIGALEGGFGPAWVNVLWKAWRARFATPDCNWSWHPYTAGERAVTLIDFASHYGLPGPLADTVTLLAAHGPAIAERLEYFGDHHTSNHLANNGSALLVLGHVLHMEKTAAMGARILVEEADRLFTSSGMLREGSSHYHLLLTSLYEKAARYHEPLGTIACNARRAAASLMLPGGLPLIGDISPDISPDRLLARLELEKVPDGTPLAGDGWLRMDRGKWSGLWHAAPGGFSHMPGHGHQDTGSFELHYEDEAVIVDPGRGAYGDSGDAALYRSSTMHNSLMLDGVNPFPSNKPYYDETFRRAVAGSPPLLKATKTGVHLDWKNHQRDWKFSNNRVDITDSIDAKGIHMVIRTLITPLDVKPTANGVMLHGKNQKYQLSCTNGDIAIKPATRWRAYGQGESACAITFSRMMALPFVGCISMEVI